MKNRRKGLKMEITRILENVPTSKELSSAYETGALSYDEFINKMTSNTNRVIEYLITNYGVCNQWIAIGKHETISAWDIGELFDNIVDKDLSYLALVDGYVSIVRTDDNEVFRLFTDKSLIQEIWK